MKALLLPLLACAALAGCADYPGAVAYEGQPIYQETPAYAYPGYPGYAYGTYGWPDAGFVYGAPAFGLTINDGRFRDGHRDWRGGEHRGGFARGDRGPDTNRLGAGPAHPVRGMGTGRPAGAGPMAGAGHAHRGNGDWRERQ